MTCASEDTNLTSTYSLTLNKSGVAEDSLIPTGAQGVRRGIYQHTIKACEELMRSWHPTSGTSQIIVVRLWVEKLRRLLFVDLDIPSGIH